MSRSLRISSLLLLFAVVLVFSGYSFAWLSNRIQFDLDIKGESISNYFYSGDGKSPETAYVLNDPRHVYYLSWLQALGLFDEQTFFRLDASIDMAGALGGSAIPPIGTDQNPFLGEFNGNGHVISNLWVSSNPEHWTQGPPLPADFQDITKVGFFGTASQTPALDGDGNPVLDEETELPTAQVAKIHDFVLENLQVTAHLSGSSVGLAAGFADCDMQNIGIKNGRISTESAITVQSVSSLIGEMGDHVTWKNAPGGMPSVGNQLLIDPSNPNNTFTALGSEEVAIVPDATNQSAYYVGALQSATPNLSTRRYYPQRLEWAPKNNQTNPTTLTTSYTFLLGDTVPLAQNNKNSENEPLNEALWNRINTGPASTYILPGSTYLNNVLQTVEREIGGTTKVVPKNGIWFQPHHGGTCTIAMTWNQMSESLSLSLYSYKRTAANGIGTVYEMQLTSPKNVGNPKWKNNTIVVFDVYLPPTFPNPDYDPNQPISDTNKEMDSITDYEFFIAQAKSGNPSTGFFYLILAGSGTSGTGTGDGTRAAELFSVDYVYNTDASAANPVYEDISQENYTPKNVCLTINGELNGTICYNMLDDPYEDGHVYHTAHAALSDTASNTVGVEKAADAVVPNTSIYYFPPRQTSPPAASP